MTEPAYHWLRVRTDGRTWTEEYGELQRADLPGIEIWGAFSGLFGIGSNELFLVLRSASGTPSSSLQEVGFEVVDHHELVPTVRPETFEPLTRDGLYVFRFFDVANDDVEEIARLSNQAWTSFEHSTDYSAEAKALFCQTDRSDPDGAMLLVTWYDGLDSWRASRSSAPEAKENFRRRRELTRRTVAFATQLVGP